uniref:FCP1 homology domain-containing protein n=1 Tax=viral metagenome TaxID=1070528 RepID=A0A6C0ECV8_9ZZZZ
MAASVPVVVDDTKRVVVLDFDQTITTCHSQGLPLNPYNRIDMDGNGFLICYLTGLLVSFDFDSIPTTVLDVTNKDEVYDKVVAAYTKHYATAFATESYDSFRDICTVLQALREKGYKIYIASNAVETQIDRYLRTIPWNGLTVRDLFDGIKGAKDIPFGTYLTNGDKIPMLNAILAEVGTTKDNLFFIDDSITYCINAICNGYLFSLNVYANQLAQTSMALKEIHAGRFASLRIGERVQVREYDFMYFGTHFTLLSVP